MRGKEERLGTRDSLVTGWLGLWRLIAWCPSRQRQVGWPEEISGWSAPARGKGTTWGIKERLAARSPGAIDLLSGQRGRSWSRWTGCEPKGTLARMLQTVHVPYMENPMKCRGISSTEVVSLSWLWDCLSPCLPGLWTCVTLSSDSPAGTPDMGVDAGRASKPEATITTQDCRKKSNFLNPTVRSGRTRGWRNNPTRGTNAPATMA